MNVIKCVEESFTFIGWFLQQGNAKSQKMSSVAFFFSRAIGEGRDLRPIMEALNPIYDSINVFCKKEIEEHKGGVLNVDSGEVLTEEEEIANLKRYKGFISGLDAEGYRRILILMENLYSPEFLLQTMEDNNSWIVSEAYTLSWILYMIVFDEEALDAIIPIILKLDSEMESF